MVGARLSRFFAEKVQSSGFDPESFGKRVKDTQVYRRTIKSSRKRPLDVDLSAEEISEACDHIFHFLRGTAEKNSPRDIYKSAGALIGRNEKGHIVILLSVNAVPLALAEKGVLGEASFKGWARDEENATVHFEMHCQLAAGKSGKLKNAIMINCDYMCPNCATLTAVFGAQQCLVDSEYDKRPIFFDRILQGKKDHSATTNELLELAGIRMVQHRPGIGLIDINAPQEGGIENLVAHEKYKSLDLDLRNEYIRSISSRLYEYRPDAESAVALVFKKKKGRIHTYYAASHILADHAAYGGHKPGTLNPLSMALIHASADGVDISKAEIYCRGKIDVNEALHLVTARPAAVHLLEGYDALSIGARQILLLAQQNIILPPHLRGQKPNPLELIA